MLSLPLNLKSCLWHLVTSHVTSSTAFEVMLVTPCSLLCFSCNCIWSHACDTYLVPSHVISATAFEVMLVTCCSLSCYLCNCIWTHACDALFLVMLPLQLHLKSCLWHLVPCHVTSAAAFEVMTLTPFLIKLSLPLHLKSWLWHISCSKSCKLCNCIWSHACDTLFLIRLPLQLHLKSCLWQLVPSHVISTIAFEVMIVTPFLIMLSLQLHLKSCLWHLVPSPIISATAFEVTLVTQFLVMLLCNCIWSHDCDSIPYHVISATAFEVMLVIPCSQSGYLCNCIWSHFVCLLCCFTSQVNSYGHCGTVSSPNHTFSWAGLNKRLTSNSCTYFRL